MTDQEPKNPGIQYDILKPQGNEAVRPQQVNDGSDLVGGENNPKLTPLPGDREAIEKRLNDPDLGLVQRDLDADLDR